MCVWIADDGLRAQMNLAAFFEEHSPGTSLADRVTVERLFVSAARAATVGDYNGIMHQLRRLHEPAHDYLSNTEHPPTTWALSHMEHPSYGVLTSNLSGE